MSISLPCNPRPSAYSPTFFHASLTAFLASLPKRLVSPAICSVIEAMSLNWLLRESCSIESNQIRPGVYQALLACLRSL